MKLFILNIMYLLVIAVIRRHERCVFEIKKAFVLECYGHNVIWRKNVGSATYYVVLFSNYMLKTIELTLNLNKLYFNFKLLFRLT